MIEMDNNTHESEVNLKNRVCLFIRVSSDKQDYDRQVNELNAYCASKGFQVTKTIATVISGRKLSRPDIIELKESADKKEFDKVIVMELSRLGRRARDIRGTLDHLHSNGISVLFKNLSIESLDDNGNESFVTNIIIAIYAELAQEEVRLLSERIKSGLRNAVNVKGKTLGRKEGSKNAVNPLEKYPELIKSIQDKKSLSECMKLHDVSKGTVIMVKKLLAQKK